uniref:Uncharacterized protein n=1 Tax=Arundo donax TaxID=35708 RepID=A0A0A8Y9P6_ARUDO
MRAFSRPVDRPIK